MKNNIYIIGAGPSGLITARELLKKGFNVSIFEKTEYVGGMCRTWKEDDYLLDTGPHIYHTPYYITIYSFTIRNNEPINKTQAIKPPIATAISSLDFNANLRSPHAGHLLSSAHGPFVPS